MEHALVVYESMFGNTEAIAEAIARGIGTRMQVTAVEVGSAPTDVDADTDLLVVGGPTHRLGLSRKSSRAVASRDAGGLVISPLLGVREWLATAMIDSRCFVATFDTRLSRPRLPGSAAAAAMRRLRRRGLQPVGPPESFWVANAHGPLIEGEIDRAGRWGDWLGIMVGSHALLHF